MPASPRPRRNRPVGSESGVRSSGRLSVFRIRTVKIDRLLRSIERRHVRTIGSELTSRGAVRVEIPLSDRAVKLDYFFDPLCGWCYASAPALEALAEAFPDALTMLPSGLFAGAGAR